jgi:histone H3/H4
MGDVLVVQSKVREVVKNADANMSGDFVDTLSKKVEEMVNQAVNRAKANGRKTVRGYDL